MLKKMHLATACALTIMLVLGACGPKNGGGGHGGGGKKSGKKSDVDLDPVFLTARDNVYLVGSEEAGFQGTAFVINYKDKKYLVTNFHVIGLLKNIFIETETKVAYKGIKVLAVDRQHDVALLDIPSLPGSVKGLHNSHNFETSQKIFVVGYPDMRSKENHLNFGTGVISDANYMAPFYMGEGEGKNIQITAPINPGHSGSPVLNERAEVIGVVSWRFSAKADIQGGNYAVPFQYVSALLTEIENRQHDIDQLFPEGKTCSDDDECQWLNFCIDGTCQKLRDVNESCSGHDDCFLPYNCFNGVCSRMGSLGDTCQNDSQCVPPNYCILGTCRPLGQKHDACKYDMDCVAPLYCIAGKCVKELSSKNGPCTQNIDCKPPLSCTNGKCQEVQGSTCTSDYQCSPLYCILGTCRDLGSQGQACGSTIDCKAGLKCVSGTCTMQALSGLGGSCTTDYDCQMPWYCIGGSCQDPSSIAKSTAQGTPCSSDMQCQPPLYCILSTCRPLGNNGDACAVDVDCNMPLYCISGVCSYSGPAGPSVSTVQGTPCTSDSQCQAPLYCILNTCRPLSNNGDPCAYDYDCVSPLYCVSGICSSSGPSQSSVFGTPCTNDSQCTPPLYCIVSTCRPLGNVGDPCQYDYDCHIPYICSGGACQSSGGGGYYGGGSAGSSTPGTVCSSDADCQPPLYCILQSCRPLGKAGDSCAIDADCSMPFVCKSGACENPGGPSSVKPPDSGKKPKEGTEESCKSDDECKKLKGKGLKYCIMNKCKKSLAKAGEACQYTTDCKKGLFCIVGTCKTDQSGRGEPCRSNDDCKRPYLCKNFICTD